MSDTYCSRKAVHMHTSRHETTVAIISVMSSTITAPGAICPGRVRRATNPVQMSCHERTTAIVATINEIIVEIAASRRGAAAFFVSVAVPSSDTYPAPHASFAMTAAC